MSVQTAVKERPILFSGAMVRAILEGRKTQTRRVLKEAGGRAFGWAQAVYPARDSGYIAWWGVDALSPSREAFTTETYRDGFPCPHGGPGERLWVRETWNAVNARGIFWDQLKPSEREGQSWTLVLYKADEEGGEPGDGSYDGAYVPSIHMPRWASRIVLEITDVRVQRVQEISEADAQREGWDLSNLEPYRAYDPVSMDKARQWFAGLWDSINAKRGYGWDVNPWVWAISFRQVER